MTTIEHTSPPAGPPPTEPAASTVPPSRSVPARGWVGPLLRRLHFYAGILVGPFIVVAATSGALYALSPQLERVVYADELSAPSVEAPQSLPPLSLEMQVAAAQEATGGEETILAVRPAPEIGDTTRVLYAAEGLGASEARTIFVDPGNGEIRGDLVTYGTSGALPLRTWIDDLHRNLHLGETGRLYSELAASWLGVVSLAGLGLWIARSRRQRAGKRAERAAAAGTETAGAPGRASGYRRTRSLHATTGIWVLGGALFLSATGITWSQHAGGNVGELRSALSWSTPSVTADLAGGSAPGEHTEHSGTEHAEHSGATAIEPAATAEPGLFDDVLEVARGENVNVGLVEITPPAAAGEAWTVTEIQRSYPTEVDAVAVDGETLAVTDRVDFDDYPFAAKLARWGIDMHQGTLFGLVNQLVLVAVAGAIALMVVWGYRMWWQRRPTRRPGRPVGKAPARGTFLRTPWWGQLAVLAVAAGVGLFLPLVGVSLVAFLVIDVLLGRREGRAAKVDR
ncbi:PepSY-associated TM helix domain-containing protein [Sanguibacter sp. 25GB23B1]|uniref:PepSY-associated TM helix domain-containing protein n=1 Tax=unclassified Sanguibacter TaxID=2645534 RepID=UPI0032AE90B0